MDELKTDKVVSLDTKNKNLFFENFIWLNTEEAAEYLRTNPKQLRNWVYQGKVKAYKLLGKSLRFKKAELELLFKRGF